MKALQIACGVSYTKIYQNLFSALNNVDVDFEVYVPQHQNELVTDIAKSDFPFKFYSNKIIKPYDNLLYFNKIKKMTRDVELNFSLSKFSLTHAHSLFNDGAVAFELKKKYKIPYIVAVRDTDVNQYFKKAFHLRRYAINIFREASYVIFLSKSYRDFVLNKYVPEKIKGEILEKARVIPNGIDNFWLNNKNKNKIDKRNDEIRLIFVGQVIRRKNIDKIIEASKLIKQKYRRNVDLTIIGRKEDKDYFNEINRKGSFNYIPYIEKEKLVSYYRESDVFVMPSITETFGLVYAEAMSQGLPVIYSKGQGFDRQFEDGEVGYKVEPKNAIDIAEKIIMAMENKRKMSENCLNKVDKFDWALIGKEYKALYNITI